MGGASSKPASFAAPAPLVPAALLLAAGIILGRYGPLPMGALIIAAAALWLAGVLAFRRPDQAPLRAACFAAGLLATGACMGYQGWRAVPANHLAAFVPAGQAPLATLEGQVVTTPTLLDPSDDSPAGWEAYPRPPRTQFLLEVAAVSTLRGLRPCQGLVRVNVDELTWRLRPGQTVRLYCRLHRPAGPRNPGQRDPRTAAHLGGTFIQASCPAADAVEILAEPAAGPAAWLDRLKTHARQHLAYEGDYEGRLLAGAMVFGVRDPALRGVEEAMARAGIAHYLSISGMHMGLLVGMAYGLMRLARLSPKFAATCVLIFIVLYLLVTDPSAPLLRAAIMAAVFCLAAILGRSASTANLLALAAIVLLVADPNELFRAAFQLSFGIVAGILLLVKPLRGLLFGRWLELRGLMVFRQDERRRRWLWRTGLSWLATTVAVSAAAWLAGLPLVAYHFGRITPAGAILTLVLLPLVAAMLGVALAQLVLSGLAPNLAGSLGAALGAFSDSIVELTKAVQHLPWLSIELRPVPIWACALVGGTILLAAYAGHLRLRRRWAGALVIAAALLAGVATQTAARPIGQGELAMLDVGHGQCAVFRAPDGRVVLIDAGSRSLAEPYELALAPFLRAKRWPSPVAAFISHGEVDHYNALGPLLDRHAPRAVFANERFGRGDDIEPLLRRLLGRLDWHGSELRRLSRGQSVDLGKGLRLVALWPPASAAYNGLTLNDSCLVLRLECAGTRVLLPGDLQRLGQQLLLELPTADLRADILILPHHGSAAGSLDAFIAAVDPKIIIRSSGRRRDGAPEENAAAITAGQVFATDRSGCVSVNFTADGPVVVPYQ